MTRQDEAATTSMTSGSVPEKLKLNLERIDAAVDGEYVENDRRLNWFLLFQAFLFQGYATALQAITGAAQGHHPEVKHAAVLMVIIIVVGFITSCLTLVATRAGIKAIKKLKDEREQKFQASANQNGITTAGWFALSDPEKLHHKGLLPTTLGPWVVVFAWVVVAAHALRSCVIQLQHLGV